MGVKNEDSKNQLRQDMLHKINRAAEGFPFRIENIVTDEITNGNLDLLEEVMAEVNIMQIVENIRNREDTEAEALRAFKNYLVSINTFCRIAAKNGKVLPLILYLISERFTITIEQSDSLDYLRDEIFHIIPRNYCKAVVDFSTIEYSDVMTDIVYEITQDLTSNLTLKEIADRHGMHPVHLARKFKTETGITFISYINELRISLAKYYFHINEHRLNEVVYLAGFNSHSYFTKVFKKITGETPTKYIRRLKTNRK